ncbi:helix-turn-helix domain-containing protein [Ligilactobacillus acidipiscis]|jgi:transcriptional regulator with XRE-family HTH domain|uniref:helix-turn-helix domain-containing protein n=1 Tax=Ligilactobacillus acidipiscis TaxID=89059 RepID=UPI0009A5ABAB|nr:helix-turn-helix transcriptional regulator [Ligilactobacillus acidipiscis]
MYRRIRNLREDLDISQERVANLLNVTQATYSRYENGTLQIPLDSLIKLALFYNTSTDYLLNLTSNKKPYSRN